MLYVVCCLAYAAQEREVVADLMSRLEQRTAERNEAMQAAAAAEARVKVRTPPCWLRLLH
jgi:hypothetical protein